MCSNEITPQILVAYTQCARKAFLHLCTHEQGTPHEYIHILEQQKLRNQITYLATVHQTSLAAQSRIIGDLTHENDLVTNVILKTEGLEAYCDVLTLVESSSSPNNRHYEPTIVIGTYSISKEQELELLFTGFVLGKIQGKTPVTGYIVPMGGQTKTFKLEPHYTMLKRFLDPLREWLDAPPVDPPPLLLNKHCPSCPFRLPCRVQAEKEDNLSLLDRVTPKLIQRYHTKGIFTVTQLSYTFKPRRSRKQKKLPVLHKLELQALSIRTNKIYLQELPVLSRHSVELFLDIEGIPDQHSYYLFGLLVYSNGHGSYSSFWADTLQDEECIWRQFIEEANKYPTAPIYHYGSYEPVALERLAAHSYGHGLRAWAVYQRLVLRLPYRLITQAIEDLFHLHVAEVNIINFLKDFARFYSDTEQLLIKRILESPFIHADETQINIQGVNQYVWVFTDGIHVVFKMTETREATIARDFLAGYQGILVSDFYSGYDAVACRQQKCLVHLIRDLNEDLWKSPFNSEFETFVLAFKNLIVPILVAVQTYGLKKKHLQPFSKHIEQFYERVITNKVYRTDLTARYQTRFKRYRESLFTFIEYDDIPWNNNMAERAIRHLAVQRKISGYFHKSFAPVYLLMLGITQTCRFQGKSLLKFLMSGEQDIDTFKEKKS